jgi:putative transposase
MSRKGNCWDNAVSESFFHTLKTELIDQQPYLTKDQANIVNDFTEMVFGTEYLLQHHPALFNACFSRFV